MTGRVPDEAVKAARAALDEYYDYEVRGSGVAAKLVLEAALPHLVAAAVHEAYVNAQRAVTAIEFSDRSAMYRLGQEHMQEDAVRAIRTAAEEARNG